MSLIDRLADLRESVLHNYEMNDAAHCIGHADAVVNNVMFIADKLGCDEEVTLLAMAAGYLHDLKCHVSRNDHDKLAYVYVMRNVSILHRVTGGIINTNNVTMVADACYEHRSSYIGEYRSLVSEIVACADRGAPTKSLGIYRRSYIYARDELGYTVERSVEHAFNHIREKFGESGYAKYPKLYTKVYGEALEQQRNFVMHVDMQTLELACKEWEEVYLEMLLTKH